MPAEPFVLDLGTNPHPRMLEHAIKHRAAARWAGCGPHARAFWHGYLAAMGDATGCAESELLDWLDRHEARG